MDGLEGARRTVFSLWPLPVNFPQVHKNRVSCSCVPIERAPRQWCWLDPSPPRGFGSPLKASKRPVGGNSAPKLAKSSRKVTRLPGDRLPSTSVLLHPFLSQDQSHLGVAPRIISRMRLPWWVTGSHCLLMQRDEGSIPGWGARIPQASRPRKQSIKQKQYCNKFNKDFFFFFTKRIISRREKEGRRGGMEGRCSKNEHSI